MLKDQTLLEIGFVYYSNHLAFFNASNLLINAQNHYVSLGLNDQWVQESIRPALFCKFISLEIGLKGLLLLKNRILDCEIQTHKFSLLVNQFPELSKIANHNSLDKIQEILRLSRYVFDFNYDKKILKKIQDPQEQQLHLESEFEKELEQYLCTDGTVNRHMGNRFVLKEFYEDPENIQAMQIVLDFIHKKYKEYNIPEAFLHRAKQS